MKRLALIGLVTLGLLIVPAVARPSEDPPWAEVPRLGGAGPGGGLGGDPVDPQDPPVGAVRPVPTPVLETGVRPEDGLMSINFLEVDIREVLSALAMERQVNIVVAKEVSGKISVHLFHVTLAEALDTITLAGGVRYRKEGDVYYVYKPRKEDEPRAEGLEIRTFKLRYADVDKVQEILDAMPNLKTVKIHEPTKTVVVEDTPENIRKVEALVRDLDARPKQVLIEAKILEIQLTDQMALGVNWEQLLGDVRIGTGGFSRAVQPTDGSVSPVPETGAGIFANMITGAGSSYQFAAALDALRSKTKVNTLSTPKILAIDGKPAKVQVGGQQGYKVTTTNLGVATETIEFIDTGTILEITPYVTDRDEVRMNVQPTINSATIEEGIPVVQSTVVSTWLLARSGETAFIGGLIQDKFSRTRDEVPYLGGIPGLGYLFGRKKHETLKSELIVLITPRIVDSELAALSHESREKVLEAEKTLSEETSTDDAPEE